MNIRHTFIPWIFVSAMMPGMTLQAATLPEILPKDAVGTRTEQEAGRTLEKLTREEVQADTARRASDRESRLLAHYREKLLHQLETLQAAEKGIEAERASLRRVRLEVGPMMEEMLNTLDAVLANDRPFLKNEREARLARLRTLMSDPSVDDGQRMDAILDAYQVEVSYGLTVGVEEGRHVDGELVTFLRLGRLGYFALNPQKATGERWVDGRWEALDEKTVAALLTVIDTASGKRPPDVMFLPKTLFPTPLATDEDTQS